MSDRMVHLDERIAHSIIREVLSEHPTHRVGIAGPECSCGVVLVDAESQLRPDSLHRNHVGEAAAAALAEFTVLVDAR